MEKKRLFVNWTLRFQMGRGGGGEREERVKENANEKNKKDQLMA